MRDRILCPLLFCATGLMAGCQGGADVKIAFDNRASALSAGQALTLGDGRTPTLFGIKMVAAYLVEDMDQNMDNVGEVGRIYVNPVCDEGLYNCGIGPGAGANRVTEYFDLALPTEEVNARLNAQSHVIKAGTYRVLRLEMTGPEKVPEMDVPNMRYGMAGETPSEVRRNNNYTVRIDPPLVLAEGDAVTMSLGYDLRDSYFGGPDVNESRPPEGVSFNDWYCGDHSMNPARGPCLLFKGFSPSVTRVAAAP
jgi:hypothetical protein